MTRLLLLAVLMSLAAVLAGLSATSRFLSHTEELAALRERDREHRLLMTTVIRDAFASNRLLAEAANGKVSEKIVFAFTSPEKMEQTAKWMIDESKRKKIEGHK